jgi:hypothetical protein
MGEKDLERERDNQAFNSSLPEFQPKVIHVNRASANSQDELSKYETVLSVAGSSDAAQINCNSSSSK